MDETREKEAKDTTPVQEYVGQGFIFADGEKSKDIVEKNKAEIGRRAIKYMKETYKTDVKVNNVVPARSAAVVMVEAEEPIQFHTSVIVGLDMKKKALDPEEANVVRSEEGVVENAILGGLFHKAYSSNFETLDSTLISLLKEEKVEHYNQKAIDRTENSGYANQFYFVSFFEDYNEILNAYLENINISSEDIKKMFETHPDNKNISINVRLFMGNGQKPSQVIVNKTVKELEKVKEIPMATYNIILYKNEILNKVGLPDGENASKEIYLGSNR
ncbi:hypothetical protein MCOL2_11487 [Listeria fleischmannii FSL S10-1203]|uniref:Uncharacterized protein n=2 Tax=Listeria fleischmannii TaxID=1069827 RepID=W7DLQ3_9LIST|nr:hypothetical protein MCOL2_11487 [Listeria fleischmannii FSL S10-1203]